MSWQIASYAILGLVLLGGFAWYERSRPPSQIVALVAALAALAVAGRVAFPVIPNVVATTDVVFFCGYAIGAAPGFVVGALAGLVSNFWLGQGPWTPWQMAGWGPLRAARAPGWRSLTAGGWAASRSPRLRPGRPRLRRPARLLADGHLRRRAVARPLPRALGSRRPLQRRPRGRQRRDRPRRRPGDGPDADPLPRALRGDISTSPPQPAPLMAARSAMLALGACPPASRPRAAPRARRWPGCAAAQNADGGFGATPGGSSSPGMTGWAALGIEAAGINPLDFARSGHNPISYLRANAAEVRTVGDLERTILVLRRRRARRARLRRPRPRRRAAGQAGRRRLLRGPGQPDRLRSLRPGRGRREGRQRALGGVAARRPEPRRRLGPRAEDRQRRRQHRRGAAGARRGGGGRALVRGVGYLRASQHKGGGFALAFGGPVNAQSTAWAVQGLLAAGADPGLAAQGRHPARLPGRSRAPPTATTATRRRATRPRSGSPARSSTPSAGRRSRSRRWRGRRRRPRPAAASGRSGTPAAPRRRPPPAPPGAKVETRKPSAAGRRPATHR